MIAANAGLDLVSTATMQDARDIATLGALMARPEIPREMNVAEAVAAGHIREDELP